MNISQPLCYVLACNVTYIISLDTESLTGPEAVRRCIGEAFELLKQKMIHPVSVHFKVPVKLYGFQFKFIEFVKITLQEPLAVN